MGWRGKFKSLKIGKKILIFNLVLFVIPCIVLSLLLFYLVQKEAYQELDNSRMVILNQIDENFEDIFRIPYFILPFRTNSGTDFDSYKKTVRNGKEPII